MTALLQPDERHYVGRDDVEVVEICCGRCGETIEGDGDSFWHKDPDLNPIEENDIVALAPAIVAVTKTVAPTKADR